jgi:hypothetical protein
MTGKRWLELFFFSGMAIGITIVIGTMFPAIQLFCFLVANLELSMFVYAGYISLKDYNKRIELKRVWVTYGENDNKEDFEKVSERIEDEDFRESLS